MGARGPSVNKSKLLLYCGYPILQYSKKSSKKVAKICSQDLCYFMVILVYCYCSRGRLTNQGTNLGKVWLVSLSNKGLVFG